MIEMMELFLELVELLLGFFFVSLCMISVCYRLIFKMACEIKKMFFETNPTSVNVLNRRFS